MNRSPIVRATALLLLASACATHQRPEPASRAAAILTWPQAQRDRYIAQLDAFFTTRTVKASDNPRPLERGAVFSSFESGGSMVDSLRRFMDEQRVGGLLVMHNGLIRMERYAGLHSPTTRWNSFSVAKSMTSTLVGAAMKDGFIKSLDDSVTTYIKGLRGSAYDGVTVKQLLTMTSGVRWNENYTDTTSDVARMYAQSPEPGYDMTVSYVRRLPREAPPGTKWVYKTSETNLVGVLVAEATGRHLADYLSEKIWRPYGMERDAVWMIDDVGHEQGGCCLGVTLRDYGRFGQFILDGARINGVPIVPDTWLATATSKQAETGAPPGYGYQWWPRGDGTFEGRGIYGQTLHIDPQRRLVIVINSANPTPTGREAGQARQTFINQVRAEIDAGR